MTASKPPTQGSKPEVKPDEKPDEQQDTAKEWHEDESNVALDHADENVGEEDVETDEWGDVVE
jgi:hypothetical protein